MGSYRTMIGGIPTLAARIADGAAAVAERILWRALVATPTAGAVPWRLAWENNAAAIATITQLRRVANGWVQDWIRDSGGTVTFDPVTGLLNMGTLGLQISVAGVLELFTAGTTAITLFAQDVAFGNAAAHRVPATVNMTNRTGGNVAVGDLVRVSAANDDSVIDTTGAGETRCMPVVTAGANLATVKCQWGAKGTVLCTTGLVTRGDPLQSSATAKQAETAAVPALGAVFGYALSGKAAGATGLVPFISWPG